MSVLEHENHLLTKSGLRLSTRPHLRLNGTENDCGTVIAIRTLRTCTGILGGFCFSSDSHASKNSEIN